MIDELLARDLGLDAFLLYAPALIAEKIGRRGQIRDYLARLPFDTPWLRACRRLADGSFLEAAEVFVEMDHLPPEALARLRGAEVLVSEGRRPEADAQLERALAFFRSVGATRYLREGEALLAAAS